MIYAESPTATAVNSAEAIQAMADTLQAVGVTANTLPAEHRASLDEQGFTVFPNVIDPAWLAALRETFERITAEEGDAAGAEVSKMEGVRRLADLVNKSDLFDRLYTHPLVLAAAYHVIGRPFKLHSINGHDPLPGYGQQAMHPDWGGVRPDPTVFHVMNSLWILDDFGPDNGATRLVPGSHRWTAHPRDQMSDLKAPHPQEIFVSAPAGSVLVFNSHAWHGSTTNRSQRTRRVYHCAFIAREHPQQTNQREYLRSETAARLSPAARYILDV
ncbi:MAG: phytanoyl-CoA dioxygenase family protein [Caldilineaceae bacterium]|nr:phytanoyl-CoA dioxygenase family protein [Caldilineaceae bacterium]